MSGSNFLSTIDKRSVCADLLGVCRLSTNPCVVTMRVCGTFLPKVKEITELVLKLSTSLDGNMTAYEMDRFYQLLIKAFVRSGSGRLSTSPVSMRVYGTLTKSVTNMGAERLCNTL
jgi:hypothetical protein